MHQEAAAGLPQKSNGSPASTMSFLSDNYSCTGDSSASLVEWFIIFLAS